MDPKVIGLPPRTSCWHKERTPAGREPVTQEEVSNSCNNLSDPETQPMVGRTHPNGLTRCA